MTPQEFKNIRIKCEMTQKDLALYLGYKTGGSQISRIERGAFKIKQLLVHAMHMLIQKNASKFIND